MAKFPVIFNAQPYNYKDKENRTGQTLTLVAPNVFKVGEQTTQAVIFVPGSSNVEKVPAIS